MYLSEILFFIPPAMIVSAQIYVAKHNMLYDKIKRIGDQLFQTLNDITSMDKRGLDSLSQEQVANIYYLNRSLQTLREKHSHFLKKNDYDIVCIRKALKEIYECISDDTMENKKQYIYNRYIIIMTNINKIM